MAGSLGKFEGRDVSGIKIIITKTGDGLSKAMTVEPKMLKQGDKGYVVLSYEAEKIRFDPSGEKTSDRVQILKATGATFADADLVGQIVVEMQERIAEEEERVKLAKEKKSGVLRIPFGEEDGE